MGFLLGAFGKLAAGQRKRDIQARMMRIQSKLRIATRQVSNVSKMLENNKKAEINLVNSTFASLSMAVSTNVNNAMQAQNSDLWQRGQTGQLQDQQEITNYNNMLTLSQQNLAQFKSQIEATKAFQLQQIEDKYEYQNDMLLEPLKMEENALQLEKDSLESQLQIADADYKACQQMEQADAKDMAPKYTAGGGG